MIISMGSKRRCSHSTVFRRCYSPRIASGMYQPMPSCSAKGAEKAAQGAKTIAERVTEFCTTHSKVILLVLVAGLLFMVISSMFSSCAALFQGGTQVILGTSFTAEDEDIIGADNDYKALEAALRNQINNIERTHSGYDEYRYDLDEINHNPYELAAYLTVKFEDYTREEVQSTLRWLFDQQYELILTEEVEIRTRTETRTGTSTSTDPETGETTTEEYEYEVEVEYEYYILNVKLVNKGLNRVIGSSGLTEDEMERYRILLQTMMNDMESGRMATCLFFPMTGSMKCPQEPESSSVF